MAKQQVDERSKVLYERVLALAKRFQFNVQIFVAIVAIACFIEILLGWNAFLRDVSLIRGKLKRKAVSYLGVLSRATLNPVLSYDWDQMVLYSRQMFEDRDVVFIRFLDGRGQVIFSSLRPSFKDKFAKRSGKSFKELFDPIFARDTSAVMFSPDTLPRLIAEETKRTSINSFIASVNSLKERLGIKKKREGLVGSAIYYQDSPKVDTDDFSFGSVAIKDKRKRTWGAVIVGFNLDGVNDEINASLYKNLAMTLFFVLLVAVNRYLTRREKLAAKAMADDIAQAKAFFADIIPKEIPQMKKVTIAANHLQSPNLGGGFYSVVKSENKGAECTTIVLANAGTTGLASSYAASMFEALTLRMLHEEPQLSPIDFVRGLRKDFKLARIGGSIDMVVLRCERVCGGEGGGGKAGGDGVEGGVGSGDGDEISVDYVAAGMEPPIVVHEKKDLLDGQLLLRRGGNGISCDGELSVEVGHLKLTKNDRLVIFNDGLSSVIEERKYSGPQLRNTIIAAAEKSADEAVSCIAEAACQQYSPAPPDDLITLVIDVE